MCISISFGGKKTDNSAANALAQQQIVQQQEAQAAAEADRASLLAEQQKLSRQQIKFNKQQTAFAEQTATAAQAIADRPDPPPTPPSALLVTGGTVGINDETINEQSRKNGRSALRIDLNSPQTAGSTGLNIPRG